MRKLSVLFIAAIGCSGCAGSFPIRDIPILMPITQPGLFFNEFSHRVTVEGHIGAVMRQWGIPGRDVKVTNLGELYLIVFRTREVRNTYQTRLDDDLHRSGLHNYRFQTEGGE